MNDPLDSELASLAAPDLQPHDAAALLREMRREFSIARTDVLHDRQHMLAARRLTYEYGAGWVLALVYGIWTAGNIARLMGGV